MRIIVDTNVLISALINVKSTSARMFEILFSSNSLEILLSTSVLSEYSEVIVRKKFIKRYEPAIGEFFFAKTCKQRKFY